MLRKVTFDNAYAIQGTPTEAGVYDVDLTLSDGELTDTQSYQITVANVNDAPILESSAYVVSESSLVGDSVGIIQAYDEDGVPPSLAISGGEVLSYAIVSGNTNSDFALNTATGEITVDNALDIATTANYSLVITATDDDNLSSQNTIYITISERDAPPVTVNDTIVVNEDTDAVVNLVSNDTDTNDNINPSSITIVTPPTFGSVVINSGGNIIYTPNPDFYGADAFTYTVSDYTLLKSNEATVSIVVNNVNDAPVATSETAFMSFTVEDVELLQPLVAFITDADGIADISSYVIDTNTVNGSLTLNGNLVIYNPAPNFYGIDSFTFHAVDASGAVSNIARVNINIAEVNDIPIALADSATTAEDTSKIIDVLANDSDPDGTLDTTTVELFNPPTHGTVVVEGNGSITYTPDANWYGTDWFSYNVQDDGLVSSGGAAGKLISNDAVVVITVTQDNDAPIAVDDSFTVSEDSLAAIGLHFNDSDVDNALSGTNITILTQPASGIVTQMSNGFVLYIPTTDYIGVDSFTYLISDGTLDSATATVNLTVTNTNDTPTIGGTPAITVAEDSTYSFIPTASDTDIGDVLSFGIINKPSWASFNSSSGDISGTPRNSDVGVYPNIIITVSDLGSLSNDLTAFSITVINVNDGPVISGAPASSVIEDTIYSFTPTASDPDGDKLTFSVTGLPSWANFNASTGAITGTPLNTDVGVYPNVIITVSSLGSLSNVLATISITVLADTDGDGIPDSIDLDDDNDGFSDTFEGSGDLDGDGIPNSLDTDSDGDGITDSDEGAVDTDGDGKPNYLDLDSDGDGISDAIEGNSDTDGDGVADYLDTSTDEDDDGIPDIIEGTNDSDNDGIADYLDSDSDNDGIPDTMESKVSGVDTDNDGIDDSYDVDETGGIDINNDGIDDDVSAQDSDSDGIANRLDIDSDNDGIPDVIEAFLRKNNIDNINAFAVSHTSKSNSRLGKAKDTLLQLSDLDNDGIVDYLDLDSDNDGISDTAESGLSGVDSDNDGIDDSYDVDSTFGIDLNNDGIDDNVTVFDTDLDNIPDLHDLDSDNDSLFDTEEARVADENRNALADISGPLIEVPIDSDGDGLADFRDLDSNNDGINDIDTAPYASLDADNDGQIDITFDFDRDGIDDSQDTLPEVHGTTVINQDQDNDGISDMTEGFADSDLDTVADYLDKDSDNDGLSDAFETDRPEPYGLDSDFDGIDDVYDVDLTGGIDQNLDGIDDQFVEVDTDLDGLADYLDTDSDLSLIHI